MPKLQTFVNDNLLKNLKEMSKQQGKSLSKFVSELIEIGYNFKQLHGEKLNKEEEKRAELIAKHSEYLLRIIAITSDIYRCVRNEKTKYKEKDIDDVLSTMNDTVRTYINGYIGAEN